MHGQIRNRAWLGSARSKPFNNRLQVTYRGRRLYLFASDSCTSVRGNSVGGFKVAKFVMKPCPS